MSWAIDSVPLVDLGRDAADPSQEFSGMVFAARLSDGRIVVGNGGTAELRLFSADGTWLQTVGRRGGGPGEFEQLGWLHVGAGDTLRSYDRSRRRLSVFSPDGVFRRSILVRPAAEVLSPLPVGLRPDGSLLVRSGTSVTPESRSGVHRDSVPLHIYGEAGTAVDSLGRVPGPEHLVQTGDRSVTISYLPFGKQLHLILDGPHLYVGSADHPEVWVLGGSGARQRIIRWRADPAPVTQADIDTHLARVAENWRPGQEEMRDQILRMVREAPFPSFKPAYAGLATAPGGYLLVRAYTEPDRAAPVQYQVFDSTGQWLGRLDMPPGLNPAQVGEDFVIGTWKDADDVDHVRLYRLRRAP